MCATGSLAAIGPSVHGEGAVVGLADVECGNEVRIAWQQQYTGSTQRCSGNENPTHRRATLQLQANAISKLCTNGQRVRRSGRDNFTRHSRVCRSACTTLRQLSTKENRVKILRGFLLLATLVRRSKPRPGLCTSPRRSGMRPYWLTASPFASAEILTPFGSRFVRPYRTSTHLVQTR